MRHTVFAAFVTLAACGADDPPFVPTANASVGVGTGGPTAGVGVGATNGTFSVGLGL